MTKTLLIAIAANLMMVCLDSHAVSKGTYIDSDVLDYSGSIAGTDANNDGLRDDVADFIQTLPDSAVQKNALRQVSTAIRAAMLLGSTGDRKTKGLREASWNIGRATKCLWQRYGGGSTANNHLKLIRQATANTQRRFDSYMKFSALTSGYALPSPQGKVCND